MILCSAGTRYSANKLELVNEVWRGDMRVLVDRMGIVVVPQLILGWAVWQDRVKTDLELHSNICLVMLSRLIWRASLVGLCINECIRIFAVRSIIRIRLISSVVMSSLLTSSDLVENDPNRSALVGYKPTACKVQILIVLIFLAVDLSGFWIALISSNFKVSIASVLAAK